MMPHRHTLLWTFGVIGATAGFLMLVSRPQLRRLAHVDSQLAAEQARSAQGDQSEKLSQLEAEVKALAARAGNFEERIPRQDSLGAFLQELAAFAQARHLRPGEIEPGMPLQVGQVMSLPVSIRVNGPFKSVYGLLQDIEAMPRLSRVETFKTELASDHPGEVSAELQVKIFYRAAQG